MEDWYSFLVMAVMPENVINGTEEDKIKTTEGLKGGRVIVEEEITPKDTGNWSDIKYISVEKVGQKQQFQLYLLVLIPATGNSFMDFNNHRFLP